MDIRTASIWLWLLASLFVLVPASLRLGMALDDEAARKRIGRNGNRRVVSFIAIRKALMYVYIAASFVVLGAVLLLPLPPYVSKAAILSLVLLIAVFGMGADLWFELRDRGKLRRSLLDERPILTADTR